MALRVLVCGATGFVAAAAVPKFLGSGAHVLTQSRRRGAADVALDLTAAAEIASVLTRERIDVVCNLAAAADVDRCERDQEWARAGNVDAVVGLAQACSSTGARLVHVSTDQVYSGVGPHTEDLTAPVNSYGRTKLAGEAAALDAGGTVLRTNVLGRSRLPARLALSDVIVRSLTANEPLIVFEDAWFSPLHQDVLGVLLTEVCSDPPPGAWNLGSHDSASKADVARGLAARLGLDPSPLRSGQIRDVEFHAPRPGDLRMDVSRLEDWLGRELPTIESSLDDTAKEYADARP